MSETCDSLQANNLTAFRIESKHIKGINRRGREMAYIRDVFVKVYDLVRWGGLFINLLISFFFNLGDPFSALALIFLGAQLWARHHVADLVHFLQGTWATLTQFPLYFILPQSESNVSPFFIGFESVIMSLCTCTCENTNICFL